MIDTGDGAKESTTEAPREMTAQEKKDEDFKKKRMELLKMAMSEETELVSFGGGRPEEYIPELAAKKRAEEEQTAKPR